MAPERDLLENVEVTDSAPEPPPRSVEELRQLLGVETVRQIAVDEARASESTPMLEVHAETRSQLQWKPRYFASSLVGSLRIKVTRLEAQALSAAGAASAP
jgi:hypothetical protein